MCEVCGIARDPATCAACGHEDFRMDAEDGFYLLRCALGHSWWSQWRARGAAPGEWKRPGCPVCGQSGSSEQED